MEVIISIFGILVLLVLAANVIANTLHRRKKERLFNTSLHLMGTLERCHTTREYEDVSYDLLGVIALQSQPASFLDRVPNKWKHLYKYFIDLSYKFGNGNDNRRLGAYIATNVKNEFMTLGAFRYQSGLNHPIPAGQFLTLFYERGHGLKMWYYNESKFVAELIIRTLYWNKNRSANGLSFYLTGADKLSGREIKIEFRIPFTKNQLENGYIQTNEDSAYNSYNYLNTTLSQIKENAGGGSGDNDRKSAGNRGEKLVFQELQSLKGKSISGYIPTENMKFNNKNFEIDFLVLSPFRGLIILEVKYHAGHVVASSKDTWYQRTDYAEREQRNPCKQVLRAKGLLRGILSAENLPSYPIECLVVYSHEKATISQELGEQPQTPVITLPMLADYLDPKKASQKCKFKADDFKAIKMALEKYYEEYDETVNSAG